MRAIFRIWVLVGFNMAFTATVQASPITIDFEDLLDGSPVYSHYPGLMFANATVFSVGISLNEFEFPPASGTNVASDDGGALSITFSSPITSFSGLFTYASPLTLQGFDALDAEVITAASLFSTNLALSGDVGSVSNESISLLYGMGLSKVVITGLADGGSFTIDDLQYQPLDNGSGDGNGSGGGDVGQVDEPPMLALFTVAFLTLLRARNRLGAEAKSG